LASCPLYSEGGGKIKEGEEEGKYSTMQEELEHMDM